jgi:type VI secretion system secreted protein VgrG
MVVYVQTGRPMTVTTPLGKDVLLLVGLAGQEGVSQPFSFHLDLLAPNRTSVPFEKLLGQKITVALTLEDGKTRRYFNGLCCRLSQGVRDDTFTSYRMEIVPEFGLLTHRVQSRIFQHLSVPEILNRVLDGLDVAFEIQGTFHPRDYCVQYRESDFAFASRLMEEEGLFYFFKHRADGHQMVIANSGRSHPEVPGNSRVAFEGMDGGNRDDDRIAEWEKVQELRSSKYTLWDHCFELPHKHLEAGASILESVQVGSVAHPLRVGGNDRLEIYDYPGEYAQRSDGVDRGGAERLADLQKIYDDNRRTAGIRMQQEALPGLVIQGSGNCRQFVSGHRFTLERHFNANGPYLLTGVQHSAQMTGNFRSGDGGEFVYQNRFTCIPLGLPFRPLRQTPRPFVRGTQTAVVVGPPGEEVFTDKYGRVKVQFHWDREGQHDADSSCWVRVAQLWAGKRWGASFWPRVGQEVVVSFLEGDPDRPLIVGSVYNADQMPPYLGNGPDARHRHDNKVSGIKSNSTRDGTEFNEWRFDDTKGKEQIFIHAERNLDTRVKNDQVESVLGNRHLTVGQERDGEKVGDQIETVYRDKHQTVQRHQVGHVEGNQWLTVGHGGVKDGGNLDLVIEKNKRELIGGADQLHVKGSQACLVDGQQDLTVKGDRKELIQSNSHLHVTADRNEKVDNVLSLTVGQNRYEKVGLNHALEVGQEIHLKAGVKLILEAGTQLSLKGPGGFIDIGPEGVAIQGTLVRINSGGAAGSGGGSSPVDPAAAELPQDAEKAQPMPPLAADDAWSGSQSARS